MVSTVDVVLVVALFLLMPPLNAWELHRGLKRAVAAGVPGARRVQYVSAISMAWLFSAIAAAAAFDGGRTIDDLRLAPPSGLGLVVSVGAVAAALAFLLQQARACGTPEGIAALRKEIEPAAWFLPGDAADLRTFRALSLTAGICEEWLFRGYMLALVTPWLGLAGAIAATTLLFAAAHFYQGAAGVVKTGLVGLFMGVLAWGTGSIWAPIVIHALLDWMQGDMIARVLRPEPS
ncbi:MAG TPA: CPBP family intramembrane glutamic endopeptidase [Kofleriaceae bacterium]|nr:CPBP family intramembrane glutamic endopeptidase [Kofleriaceae bacterium]